MAAMACMVSHPSSYEAPAFLSFHLLSHFLEHALTQLLLFPHLPSNYLAASTSTFSCLDEYACPKSSAPTPATVLPLLLTPLLTMESIL